MNEKPVQYSVKPRYKEGVFSADALAVRVFAEPISRTFDVRIAVTDAMLPRYLQRTLPMPKQALHEMTSE